MHSPGFASEEALDDALSDPRQATIDAIASLEGDVVVLGAGGKMGPTLSRMVRRAMDATAGGRNRRVTAVSRFGSSAAREVALLERAGVLVQRADLLDREALSALPDAPSVLFLAGQKFGTTDHPERTWMSNAIVPWLAAERYRASRIVAFSTGNVYPLVPVSAGGARETDATAPVGEYAASCLARERVFEHASAVWGTRVTIMRLNYAIDLRYGVLTDLALAVRDGRAVDLAMGSVNVIWQRDANCAAIELLAHCTSPPRVVNVTGSEILSVRSLAEQLATRLGTTARFTGAEHLDALLSNTSRMQELLGAPDTPLAAMLDRVANWVRADGRVYGKATHFDTRDGAF